jgi:hypothetical protein
LVSSGWLVSVSGCYLQGLASCVIIRLGGFICVVGRGYNFFVMTVLPSIVIRFVDILHSGYTLFTAQSFSTVVSVTVPKYLKEQAIL